MTLLSHLRTTTTSRSPAAILAKMLGIHIKAAIHWQQLSNGDWTTYAAEVSQRARPN